MNLARQANKQHNDKEKQIERKYQTIKYANKTNKARGFPATWPIPISVPLLASSAMEYSHVMVRLSTLVTITPRKTKSAQTN
jgi:hypothetical protein